MHKEKKYLKDGKLWMWFGCCRAEIPHWHEESLKWRTRTSGVILCLQPPLHPHITHKPPLPVSQTRPQPQLETPAVMWRITSLFQTAAGTFLSNCRAKMGFMYRRHGNQGIISVKREKSDKFLTLRRKVTVYSPQRRAGGWKKIRAGNLVRIKAWCSAVISPCYVTQERFHWEPERSINEEWDKWAVM